MLGNRQDQNETELCDLEQGVRSERTPCWVRENALLGTDHPAILSAPHPLWHSSLADALLLALPFYPLSLICILLPEQKHPRKPEARQQRMPLPLICVTALWVPASTRTNPNNSPLPKLVILKRRDKLITICRPQDHVPREAKRRHSKNN